MLGWEGTQTLADSGALVSTEAVTATALGNHWAARSNRHPVFSRSSPIPDVQAGSVSAPTTESGEVTTPATPGDDSALQSRRSRSGRLPVTPAIPIRSSQAMSLAHIYRSTDEGLTWHKLPVNVTFPAVSEQPQIPKRIISIAVDPANPDEIYASLEVGGLLCSHDGGQSWINLIDGLYIDEGSVDIHSVVVNPKHAGQLTVATRFGTFRSVDRGLHWRDLKAPLLRPIGSYCRVLAYAPGDANALYLAAGNDFDGDRGALFVSRDDGATWEHADLGIHLKTTIFGLAVNPNLPDHVFCSSKIGQVLHSYDRGKHWRVNPLPHGVGHVFALAAAEIPSR